MCKKLELDYYYGNQAEQFSFFRLPKVLVRDKRFKGISSDAKILYGIMLDRMSLSIKNGWTDKYNRVYIIFTLEEIAREFECSERKASMLMAELDTVKGIGLIEKKRQGMGRPNLIYLKNFVTAEEEINRQDYEEKETKNVLPIQNSKNMRLKSGKILQVLNEKLPVTNEKGPEYLGNDEGMSSQSGKILQVLDGKDMQVRSGKILQGNNTENNNTDFSNTEMREIESIHLHAGSLETEDDVMDQIDITTRFIKQNIGYNDLKQNLRYGQSILLDEIVQLLVETILVERTMVRIAGADYPYPLVRERLLSLDESHIQYVLDCLNQNRTKVYNIKSYLLTTLFNAPATIESFYTAEAHYEGMI